MRRYLCLVCLWASVLALTGCDNSKQSASSVEPAAQKIKQAAATSPIPVIVEATPIVQSVRIVEATPNLKAKSALVAPLEKPKSRVLPVLDMKKFRVARTLELPYYRDGVHEFCFSPDGKTLAGAGQGYVFKDAVAGERGVVFIFDVKSGALLKRLASEALPGSSGSGPNFDRVSWSPDGKSVAAWNVDSYGSSAGGASLCVWDVKSGQRTAAFRNANWAITNVAWMRDGSLIVSRNNRRESGTLPVEEQLMICDGRNGQINKIYDLGKQAVVAINVSQQGTIWLLIVKPVGEAKTYSSADAQSYICSFDNGVLSQPLLQFPVREFYFATAFTKNGLVALSGFEQLEQDDPNGIAAGLYAVVDLNTGEIVWQTKQKPIDSSYRIVLSPDEREMRAFTGNRHSDFVFDMRSGDLSDAPNTDRREFPYFAPNGKSFVRLSDRNSRGQKPHLKIAEIYER